MTREIRVETNQRGAGYYGAPAPSHVTRCVHSRNPFGHNPECNCGWARVPDVPIGEPDYPVSPHERWWK